jgi:putative membrane protein
MKENELPLNDLLTVEMTYLSNERSLLAYMRTFMVFLSSGIAILKIQILDKFLSLGYLLIILSVIILIIEIFRFFKVKKNVKRILVSIDKERL